ncbi:MAG: hypothetical protein P1V51_05275 [Deltaproteobacteria bacterium]|nr:hypothetical protein [Deltaproteobacteria bacterium]
MSEALPREIERKYLLSARPELPAGVEKIHLVQGWLPGERLRERLRRTTFADGRVVHHRALKLGRGVERIELEEETTPEIFEHLWVLTEGCRVEKERYLVPAGADGLCWEIDVFLDRELYLCEVELPSADLQPEPPPFVAAVLEREVTEEPGFTNLELAR